MWSKIRNLLKLVVSIVIAGHDAGLWREGQKPPVDKPQDLQPPK